MCSATSSLLQYFFGEPPQGDVLGMSIYEEGKNVKASYRDYTGPPLLARVNAFLMASLRPYLLVKVLKKLSFGIS